MQKKHIQWITIVITLLVLTGIAISLSLISGEMNIHLTDLHAILTEKSGIEYAVLTRIRFPRIILAFSIGGALSLTGTILQGIYRNPLVEPFTLGISGGASFGVALAMVTGLHLSAGMLILPASGFAGALLTIFLVYALGMKKGGLNINRMLLIGVMISFLASSATMLLMSVTSAENLHGIVFWTMGSLDEPNRRLILLMLFFSLSGLVISFLFARPLNALRLGEAKAQHMGINTPDIIRFLFILSSLLTGICVAVAGVIGFVGLIIPHIMRMIIGSDHRILLISSYLGGSIFLIFSDIAARTIISPNELPIGVITGIAGGMAFIIILLRTKSRIKIS